MRRFILIAITVLIGTIIEVIFTYYSKKGGVGFRIKVMPDLGP